MATTREVPEHSNPVVRVFTQRKMAAILLLGFASGLPLFLTSQTLAAWMRVEGTDLTTIGIFGLVALPYSLKFIWAPFFDRYVPPFLGRRRGWLLITQLALFVAIAAMSLHDPRLGLRMLAVNAIHTALPRLPAGGRKSVSGRMFQVGSMTPSRVVPLASTYSSQAPVGTSGS